MNIFYTSRGIPMLEIDSVIYTFNSQNAALIIGALTTEIDLCAQIKEKVVQSINDIVSEKTIENSSSSQEINKYINNLSELTEFYIVNDILNEAEDNYKQLITPKPYEAWVWSREKANWEPPVQYPTDAAEGAYLWSDELHGWIPSEPAPHVSWVWDHRTHEYVPPVSYPLDAQEGEFVWDEEKLSWVLNV